MIGDVDVPEKFPKASKRATESRPQPSFGPCLSTYATVGRSKEELNRGEAATLRSPPIFMLVADTGLRQTCI
jgi:hypothetical protein